MEEKKLEQRMYFFVCYQLTGIQQAIQAGHASLEYAYHFKDDPKFMSFVENDKTWIILNGGTTNDRTGSLGSLNEIYVSMLEHDALLTNETIGFSSFREPDLNDALTAVCFLADERVFNYEDYPDIMMYAKQYMENIDWLKNFKNGPFTYESIKESLPKIYEMWVRSLGGEKNVFLRNLIKGKKLAGGESEAHKSYSIAGKWTGCKFTK